DSVFPPTVNYDETSIDGVMRSLNLIFAACRNDTGCNFSYPDLEEHFYQLLKTADKKPLIFHTILDGEDVPIYLKGKTIVTFIHGLIEDTQQIAEVPSVIEALSKGDYDSLPVLRRFADFKLKSEGFVWGARYSAWCQDVMPFENSRKMSAQ